MGNFLSRHGFSQRLAASQHRSIHSADQAMILFHNGTERTIGLIWMDYRGRKRPYFLLPPGHYHLQNTFLSHPWTFEIIGASMQDNSIFKDRNSDINEIDCSSICAETHEKFVYADDNNSIRKVTIVESPPVHWCIHSHAQYFHTYKPTVKSVLLCHHRLRKQGYYGEGGHLGDLPLVRENTHIQTSVLIKLN